MFLRRPASDENATATLSLSKGRLGLGFNDASKPTLGKLQSKMSAGMGAQSLAGPRKALGDLTNTQKGAASTFSKIPSVSFTKPTVPKVPEPPVEKLAGKSWHAMQEELALCEEAELQQRLDRIRMSASTWTSSHLFVQDDTDSELSSDSDTDDERFEEIAIVVQLIEPTQSQGGLASLGQCEDTTALLPSIPDVALDLDFCWTDDETE